MIRPPAITDNLTVRVTAILLAAFILIAIVVCAVMLWPRQAEPNAGLFELPAPTEAAAIVEAIEHSSPEARPYVVRALNTSSITADLETDFPPMPPGLSRAPTLELLFQRYSAVLQGHVFRVDIRRGWLPNFLSSKSVPGARTVQMSIRLRDGHVLVIERRPPAVLRTYIARAAITGAVVGLVLLAALVLAVRQTTRPVNQLAHAARSFSLDGDAPDLPARGPHEIRELSAAFNELQHRIRSLVEERTRVLGAVAHDLRTYLTRLRLRTDFIDDCEQRVKAEHDIEEMSQLLDDILLFSAQATRPAEVSAPLDLAAATSEFAALRAEMDQPVTFAPLGEAAHLAVLCPALAYRRMLANLVENALRYGGVARLSLHLVDGRAEVWIDDDGPGIPSSAVERLMRPFERLESSRARTTGGAGLGLAIVQALAESCRGELRLQIRIEGGLRAALSFPIMATGAATS